MAILNKTHDKMTTKNLQFYYKNNRLQQLRGFCYTAQFGNITRAATHMGLTQSSVSQQIKALEDELGVELFSRNGPHITLTKDGQRLLKMALPHVDGIQSICDQFHRELISQERTEVVVSINSTARSYLMPPVINDYIASYEDVYVTLVFGEQDSAVSLLEAGEIDCAVLPRRPHKPFPETCMYHPIYYFRPCLITRKDHPLAGRKNLSIEEISRYPLTLPAPEFRVIPNLYDIFPQSREQIKWLRINFKNMETGREYIEAGLVVTISSEVFVSPSDDDILAATPLTHLFDMVDYGFLTRNDGDLPEKVINLMNTAKQHASKLRT